MDHRVLKRLGAISVSVAIASIVLPVVASAPATAVPPARVISTLAAPPYPGVLSEGSSGRAVVWVQKGLLRRGYAIPTLMRPDAAFGYYGSETAAAVFRFKRNHPHLGTINGQVGPNTYAALVGPTSGSSGGASGGSSSSGGGSSYSSLRANSPHSWTSPAYAQWYAVRRLAHYGWSIRQYATCLRPMWIGESHWQYREVTGKYVGIPQTTPGVAGTYGFSWSSYRANPEAQIEVGLRYIRDRYGSPCAAWSFWKAQGAWQDNKDPVQWWGGWY